MNLRKAKDYTIGLDLGTSSVGWAVVDAEGELYHFKGKPTWGSRLFGEAETAAGRRVKRGQRRRYARRRMRIEALQKIFAAQMSDVDPDFFARLNQSRLYLSERGFRWPLLAGNGLTEPEYYLQYPTIFHLRHHLTQSADKADLRLVYLALHNIVKYRGNFLYEEAGSSLKASNANSTEAAGELAAAIQSYMRDVKTDLLGEDEEPLLNPNVLEVASVLDQGGVKRADRKSLLIEALHPRGKLANKWAGLLANAILGYKVEYSNVFDGMEKDAKTSFDLRDEEKPLEFVEEVCPDNALELFEALRRAYSAFVLSGILQGASGISAAMVRSYEQHGEDLATLKALFRDYLTKEEYDEFFRGEQDERGEYDINELVKGSYTSYVSGEKKANSKGTSHEELMKKVKALCAKHKELQADPRYMVVANRIEAGAEGDFLAKQKVRANGAIPYQLHLEEMDAIIEHQGKYYPFLLLHREEIEVLVSSRIPYYVGPLYYGNDPASRQNAWSVRKPGMEHVRAYPWNVEEVIDTDKTAELFIQRMTGTCTYLYDEPVLPRHSLLYEEFCVLNELNGSRWGERGKRQHRFDREDKQRIMEELFKHRATVTYQLVKQWLEENECNVIDPEVSGAQGATGYESKLSTYRDFCRILNVKRLEDGCLTFDEIEEIVLWSTLFEDRKILRRKLVQKYGAQGDRRLSDDQIRKIVKKRYSGWGRLSRKLLTGLYVEASVPSGRVNIMDILRDGNPCDDFQNQMVLMEVLRDKRLGFQERIDQENDAHFGSADGLSLIESMHGSPANRRAVNQAIRIIDEIISIAGNNKPARICLEVTRDDDFIKKGSRPTTRYRQLKEALRTFNAEATLYADLEKYKGSLDNDKLLLYFEQQGKCMYTKESLDIDQLNTYHIDHIIPQSYVKDDSLSNRVLVKSVTNERKLDSLLLPEDVIRRRSSWWKSMLDAGLISRKKYENLTCRSLSDRMLEGFIARQLVETSQVIKFVRQFCEQRYPGTEVVSVRANISHSVRENLELVKCRDLNNYHHAHDAFLACQVADFVGRCYPSWQNGFDLALIRRYVKSLSGGNARGRTPGRSGFIADSMTSGRTFVNEETGELVWDGKDRCAHIIRSMGYGDCFISRMVEIATGGFWDETVYSPRDRNKAKGLSTPLKSSRKSGNREGVLDPQKYGGVSSVKQAYWFIFAAKTKRGAYEYFFEGLPIHLAGSVGDNIQEYANAIAHKNGCGDAIILRQRVPLRQKLELDGTPYYLYGSTGGSNEIRCAKELRCGSALMRDVAQLLNTQAPLEEDRCLSLYDWLCDATDLLSPKLAGILKLRERRVLFAGLDSGEQASFLKALIAKLKGSTQTLDARGIGGAGKAGFLLLSIAKALPSITWIDQSVTGMYEMRTTFEDLTRGL